MARKKSAAKKAREAAAREAATAAAAVESTKLEKEQELKNNLPVSDSDDNIESSDSEDEDDFGELITEDVEHGINEVLNAIKNNETNKLLDPNVKFFNENNNTNNTVKTKKEKPIYLKDYHRMNILSGDALKSDDELDQDNEQTTIDGQKSFVTQQRDERNKLLDEIKNAIPDTENDSENGSDDDDGFLKKKEPTTKKSTSSSSSTNKISKENDDEFLDDFMSKQAWIPQTGDKIINLDNQIEEDDEEFENAVEDFENAYNFRYEDPNAAEIISYARNQATLRRSDNTSRRRKRDAEKMEKESIKLEKESKIQKKKTKKINKLTDVLEQLQKEFGAKIEDHMVNKITKTLMNSDYKENDWDNVIAELFNDEFYNDDSEKPTWNDEDDGQDIDMLDDDEENEHIEEEEEQTEQVEETEQVSNKKAKKDAKHAAKKEKEKLAEMVENAVEANKLAIVDEVENERGRSKTRDDDDDGIKFRYREVSPESFGLSTREIFAADDADLNDFISLKKFAPYRAKELRNKDKRKVTKARRIKDWKKKTFNDENGPTFDGVWLPKDDDNKKSKHHHHHHHNNKKDRSHKKSKK
ncbi:protein Kri1p [Monosporozyma unispora]|nr:KRRI-Interacting protein 1 [Kazachstania unispora]